MIKETINLSAVEYLNTKPFIEGLRRYRFEPPIMISQDTPAQCSEKLQRGKADIGIVPVADFQSLKGFRKITRWGIGADGAVESVLLVSNGPIESLDTIYLDYQSRTSNQLMRILLDEFYGYHPQLLTSRPGYLEKLPSGAGAVVIGDRALNFAREYAFTYDLSQSWKEMTGLPFVFAIWVASDKVTSVMEEDLSNAFAVGMARRSEVAQMYSGQYPGLDVYHYLTQCIRYDISETFEAGMELFLEKIQMLEGIY